jgi:hypothetical protein
MSEKIQFRVKVNFKENSQEKNEVHKIMAENAAEAVEAIIRKYKHVLGEIKVYVKPI